MLYHVPRFIKNWTSAHKHYLWFISSISLAQLVSPVIYAVLPVIVAAQYGEWYAGLLISGFGLAQALLFNPVAGAIADKIGTRRTILIGFALGALAGAVWLIFSIHHLSTLLAFSFLLFLSYGFRSTSETYILKTGKKNEGGTLFGIYGNVASLAIFLSTVLLPFFVITGHNDLAAALLSVGYVVCFIILFFLPNDDVADYKHLSLTKSLNPLPAIRRGWHFVHMNDHYPLLSLGASLFEGVFYGTIWFVFPIHMAKLGLGSGEGGMHLGIYDLVTALFAGYAGYLADKYNWRHTHSLGWIFVILGLIALPFYSWPTWLVVVGFIIAIGNNLSYYAAAHALRAHDIDHHEDGSFIGLKSISNCFGYAIAPIAAGYLYVHYGFTVSLAANSLVCIVIALSMVWLTWRLENRAKRRHHHPLFD